MEKDGRRSEPAFLMLLMLAQVALVATPPGTIGGVPVVESWFCGIVI